jgi:hypothetical protein
LDRLGNNPAIGDNGPADVDGNGEINSIDIDTILARLGQSVD